MVRLVLTNMCGPSDWVFAGHSRMVLLCGCILFFMFHVCLTSWLYVYVVSSFFPMLLSLSHIVSKVMCGT